MAIQRFFSSSTTATKAAASRNFDVEDDSNSSRNGDLNISEHSSSGHSSRNMTHNSNNISSSPRSKSKNKFVRERLSPYDQQQQPQQQQRLSSKTMNRHPLSSCCSHQTIMTGMLLCCVAVLSFTMNWNDMLAQRQQSTLSPIGLEQRRAVHKLSLIPSIDELTIGVSSQSLRDEIARRQAAASISRTTSDASESEEHMDEVTVTKQISPEIDYSMNRPPLDTIIDDDNKIIGDPEWLLDFAILGYGKCGTSTMMHWLREHPEIQAFGREKGHFMSRKPGLMVRQLYEVLEPGPYQRGYKAPQDVTQVHILNYYRTYWPNAKLILGIRHPIRWFESLYNFRIQNLKNASHLPHPNNLIGPCRQGRYLTCTNKGDFAYSLLKLGQQNYPKPRPATELELSIAGRYNRTVPFDSSTVEYMYNPIFIFELDQLGDSNVTRNDLFRSDFTKFMGLKEPLPSLPHYKPGMERETEEQLQRDALKIKICDDEYIPVRNELMGLARSTSQWIREVFLKGPTVYVSSKEYFISILEGWMKDPCDDETRLSGASTEAKED
jgi:hypothetical protein